MFIIGESDWIPHIFHSILICVIFNFLIFLYMFCLWVTLVQRRNFLLMLPMIMSLQLFLVLSLPCQFIIIFIPSYWYLGFFFYSISFMIFLQIRLCTLLNLYFQHLHILNDFYMTLIHLSETQLWTLKCSFVGDY